MAFPDFATVAQGDDFNRADENPLSGAGRWHAFGGVGLAAPLKLLTNQALSAGTAGQWVGSYWDSEYTDTEMFVKVATQVTTIPKNLKTRLKKPGGGPPEDPAQDGYQVTVDENGNGRWRIYRIDNGVATLLGVEVTGFTVASGDQIGFSSIGNVHTGWRKVGAGAWTQIIQRTDSTYTIGRPGIVLGGSTVVLDDFGVGGMIVSRRPPLLIWQPAVLQGPV